MATVQVTFAPEIGQAQPEPHPLDVTWVLTPRGPFRTLFRKCCPCMFIPGASGTCGVVPGQRVEFVCGCGSHPSVMVCDGKVIGTSA